MIDSCRLRKLEPGLVVMYSRSSVLMTSYMKSEPGRSITMSPECGLSFFPLPGSWPGAFGAGASCRAASGDWARTVGVARAAEAAADFRKVRRSTPDFLASSIVFLLLGQ